MKTPSIIKKALYTTGLASIAAFSLSQPSQAGVLSAPSSSSGIVCDAYVEVFPVVGDSYSLVVVLNSFTFGDHAIVTNNAQAFKAGIISLANGVCEANNTNIVLGEQEEDCRAVRADITVYDDPYGPSFDVPKSISMSCNN